MTYTDDDHAAAVEAIHAAQDERADVAERHPALPGDGWTGTVAVAEPSRRVWESMAPENTGTRGERFTTILHRARLADSADRSARRRAAMTDGEIRNPIELARAAGLRVGNRAARRAAARQARAAKRRGR